MKVLAIDPGPTPGLATYDTETGVHLSWVAETWLNGCQWIALPNWGVIVCERFNIGGQRGHASNETIEMIGVARYFAALHEIPFVEQQPGAHKFITPAKLKALGWSTPGPDHARSAAGHLLLYLVSANLVDRNRLLPS